MRIPRWIRTNDHLLIFFPPRHHIIYTSSSGAHECTGGTILYKTYYRYRYIHGYNIIIVGYQRRYKRYNVLILLCTAVSPYIRFPSTTVVARVFTMKPITAVMCTPHTHTHTHTQNIICYYNYNIICVYIYECVYKSIKHTLRECWIG